MRPGSTGALRIQVSVAWAETCGAHKVLLRHTEGAADVAQSHAQEPLPVAGNLLDEDNTCRCCPARENIVHLVRCGNILIEIGCTVPTDYKELETFWLVGRLTDKKAVTPEQSGMMFIAWRCLYADIVRSRVDKVPISMLRA